MLITAVKYTIEIITIELEHTYILELPVTLEHKALAVKGKELDEDKYAELKQVSENFRAFRHGLRYLTRVNHSTFELKQYLKRKEYSAEAIDSAVTELQKFGYLNDVDFCRKFIDYQRRRRPVGANYLRNQLQKKGISKEIIIQMLQDCGAMEDDLDGVYKIAQKKLNLLHNKKNKLQKLVYFLQQRGFGGETIQRVLTRFKTDGISLSDDGNHRGTEGTES